MCNLQFADNIDFMGGSSGELHDFTNMLIDRARASRMEVSTERSNIMINSTNNISADISINGQSLEEVTNLKYLGATLCKDDTCSAEICIRIVSALVAVARLNRIWQCKPINFTSTFKLHKSFVTSILLYGCDWLLEKGPGFRNQVPQETSSHLLLVAHDQWLGVE